ncbi:MAG: hypothetical protein BWY98_01034 [Tenericutes bacterium ADurb.BinA155]|nr:MAG: hypothetical protein BWY98_01034 [Tenericutes bacterium ADurb.BinA155]
MSKKGIFYGLSLLLPLAYLGSNFAPVYSIAISNGSTTTYSLGNIIAYCSHGNVWALVGLSLGASFILVSLVFLLLSLKHLKDIKSDKVDRYYVYGEFFLALSGVILTISDIGAKSYIAMAISLCFVLLPFLFIFIHYKFLTDY